MTTTSPGSTSCWNRNVSACIEPFVAITCSRRPPAARRSSRAAAGSRRSCRRRTFRRVVREGAVGGGAEVVDGDDVERRRSAGERDRLVGGHRGPRYPSVAGSSIPRAVSQLPAPMSSPRARARGPRLSTRSPRRLRSPPRSGDPRAARPLRAPRRARRRDGADPPHRPLPPGLAPCARARVARAGGGWSRCGTARRVRAALSELPDAVWLLGVRAAGAAGSDRHRAGARRGRGRARGARQRAGVVARLDAFAAASPTLRQAVRRRRPGARAQGRAQRDLAPPRRLASRYATRRA